jgi:hypothetical protein
VRFAPGAFRPGGQNGTMVDAATHDTPHCCDALLNDRVHVRVPIDPVQSNMQPTPHGVLDDGPGTSRPTGQKGLIEPWARTLAVANSST